MARATLAPREGMAAQVPALRKRPLADMKDMGMGEMDMGGMQGMDARSEEHTSELQSLMRISYAVFCLKKNTIFCLLTTINNRTLHTNSTQQIHHTPHTNTHQQT